MEITISIINYNYGQYLKQAIESALNQTTDVDYEVLVIDDGSTDNSDEIIASYQSHPKFRSSKTENRGFAAALTRALTEANGYYVFFMDADDYFELDKINVILPLLKMKTNYYVADCPKPFDNKGGFYSSYFPPGCTSTVAVNREKALVLCPVENELWFHTLKKLGFGIFLETSYTNYRIHGSNMTNRTIAGKWQNYLYKMTFNLYNQLIKESDNIADALSIKSSKVIKTAKFLKAQGYYNKTEMHLELGSRSKAFKAFLKMVYYNLITIHRIKFFDIKMLIRVILVWPSQKKG
ncbi:glycosyltransferase family 2 protein [Flavobacterium sp. 120]|uniref:glycosyltransferase family 2 protein n=1 Tax=Flavobacterium sp. 120 TaxID=2135626 RepID=UPI000EAE6D9F|nr:glycosyltransferase family 2 protein [Flavobacterium sp. 120]RKS13300.1 glycosyltransferase involved in cell wall biosynthesis [Flavobacterium sp. 120]